MGSKHSDLHHGQIVWARVRDHRGFRKIRPVIILTPDDEISADEPLVLMAITTTYPDPPPANHVELPWNPVRKKVATGLARRSAAVVDWLETAYIDEIQGLIGMVPVGIMEEIMRRLSKP